MIPKMVLYLKFLNEFVLKQVTSLDGSKTHNTRKGYKKENDSVNKEPKMRILEALSTIFLLK